MIRVIVAIPNVIFAGPRQGFDDFTNEAIAELDYAPLSPGVQKKVEEALAELTLDGKPVASAAK